ENLKNLNFSSNNVASDKDLDGNLNQLMDDMQIYIEDDFNTARVLANLFEIVPVINSFKDGIFEMTAISSSTLNRLKDTFHLYLVTILGLKNEEEADKQFS